MKKVSMLLLFMFAALVLISCKGECEHIFDDEHGDICLNCGETLQDDHQSEASEINDAVRGLNYDPTEILQFDGRKYKHIPVPKSGKLVNGAYTVLSQTKRTLTKTFDPVAPVSDSVSNQAIYPGSVILADRNVANGTPTAVDVKRGAVTLRYSGLRDVHDIERYEVSEASYKAVSKEIANRTEYSGYLFNLPTVQCKKGLIFDEQQLQLEYGCDFDFIHNRLPTAFTSPAYEECERSMYLVQYTIELYTVSIEPFTSPADAFDPSVTADDLRRAGMSDESPLAYIESVTYGVQMYILFTYEGAGNRLAEMLENVVGEKGLTLTDDIAAQYADVIADTRIFSYFVNGSATRTTSDSMSRNHIDIINQEIEDCVQVNCRLYEKPLYYKMCFLKDNSTAVCGGTTEYIERTGETYEQSKIVISYHSTVKFYISWKEITGYDEDGNALLEPRLWVGNGRHYDKSTYQSNGPIELSFDGNCTDITISAEREIGLAWQQWQSLFSENNLERFSFTEIDINALNYKIRH